MGNVTMPKKNLNKLSYSVSYEECVLRKIHLTGK